MHVARDKGKRGVVKAARLLKSNGMHVKVCTGGKSGYDNPSSFRETQVPELGG
jgi:hypothetical protein